MKDFPDHKTPYTGHNTASALEDNLMAMQLPIQELHEFVSRVAREWSEKLKPLLDPHLAYFTMPVQNIYENGIETLEKLYRGTIVETLQDVFSLLLVAYASTHSLHEDDGLYCCDEFFRDGLQWEHAIENRSDKDLFTKVIHKIWTLERVPTFSHVTNLSANPSFDEIF